jgi:hypothetical protein
MARNQDITGSEGLANIEPQDLCRSARFGRLPRCTRVEIDGGALD